MIIRPLLKHIDRFTPVIIVLNVGIYQLNALLTVVQRFWAKFYRQ